MKRQGVPLEDLSRLMSKKFEVPCKRRGCEIVTRSTTAAEAIVKSKLWTCTLWKTTVKIKLLQNKNQWSLITMQNHDEKFYHICEKMKLQIHALLNWCWYDDICVIAEDDPVGTLWLAFGHICYSNQQIIVHIQYVEQCALCNIVWYSYQIILTGCIFVMGIERRSRNPQSAEVLPWFAVIWLRWCECCLRFEQLNITRATKSSRVQLSMLFLQPFPFLIFTVSAGIFWTKPENLPHLSKTHKFSWKTHKYKTGNTNRFEDTHKYKDGIQIGLKTHKYKMITELDLKRHTNTKLGRQTTLRPLMSFCVFWRHWTCPKILTPAFIVVFYINQHSSMFI